MVFRNSRRSLWESYGVKIHITGGVAHEEEMARPGNGGDNSACLSENNKTEHTHPPHRLLEKAKEIPDGMKIQM